MPPARLEPTTIRVKRADSELRRYCERILRVRSTGWTQGIFANFAAESMAPIDLAPTKDELQSKWYTPSNDYVMWYTPRSPPIFIGGMYGEYLNKRSAARAAKKKSSKDFHPDQRQQDDISKMADVVEQKIESEIQRLYKHRETRLNKIAKEDKQRKIIGHMNSSAHMKLAIEHCVPKKEVFVGARLHVTVGVLKGGREVDGEGADPPDQTSKDYEQWEQKDLIVFSWLIQNIEPALAGNLTEYPTAKMLWDALVVTYSSGRDKLQTFNLHVKANDIKQNNSSLEDFWISLQGFLNALDRRYVPIKREILRLEPLPSAEAAYATVRKEAAHQNILGATINETQGIAAGLIATETEGLGLVSKINRRSDRSQIGSSSRVDKSKLKCGECGMTGHTKERYFRLVSYPDWWTNGHKKGTKNYGLEKGKAYIVGSTKENDDTTDQKNLTGFGGMATVLVYSEEDDGPLSMNTGTGGERPYVLKTPSYLPNNRYFLNDSKRTPKDSEMLKNTSFIYFIKESFKNCKRGSIIGGVANIAQNLSMKRELSWIFDCGATYTMTYDLSNFATSTKPTKSYIDTANEEKMIVKMGELLKFYRHLSFRIDIRTGAIIGRGTEIKGLYYVDEVTQNGTVMLSHWTAEREAWLWHRRLGHPSNGYLHVLFPKLFPSNLVRGDSECLDILNWLRYVACGDERSHSTTNESHLSTQPEDHVNVTQTAPNLIPEVSNPSPISNPIETNASWQKGNVQKQEMVFNQDDTPSELNEHVQEQNKSSTEEETSERYVLPPRANRGVPPKRYYPEKVSRGSKYPMANIAKGNLSKEAKAFVAAVYSDEIPANTEQALKSRKWKKQWKKK
nr:hypothetical protein [Tanacetum cinerariifolium]